jgi:predicted negative regulator of RcsB-dependent stress response
VAKNKGTYRSRREAAKEDEIGTAADMVAAAEAASFFTRHRGKVLLACGVLAAAMVVVVVIRWREHRREEAATAVFDQALNTLSAQIESSPAPAATAVGDEPEVTYPTVQARLAAALAELDQLAKGYASTDLNHNASVARAGVLFDLGRYSDAEAVYRQAANDDHLVGILRLLAREGVARCLEAKAMAEKDEAARKSGLMAALAEYKAVQPDEKGLEHDAAVFHQGRLLALTGDIAGAKAMFKDIVEHMPSSPFVSDATDRLAALE